MSGAGRHGAARPPAASPGAVPAPARGAGWRRSRAGRTLVALLGVSSVALTAAAAQPVDPGDRTRPGDVFALGAEGLGSLDVLVPEEDGTDREGGRTRSGSARERPGADDGSGASGPAGADAAVEIPVLGGETLASVIPAGLGGGGAGIPAPTLRAYRAAAEVMAREAPGCRIDWALLAGIGRVEANHGRFGGASVTDQGVSVPRILGPRLDGSLAGTQVVRDTDGGSLDGDAAYDRAVGPMQFLPGTWRRWGSDGDRDGASDPQDIDDAALAAARYLCEGRDSLDDPAQAALAVRRYNNSSSYVDLVLATAAGYRSGGPGAPGGGLDPFGEDPFGTAGFDPLDPFGDGGGYWSPFTPGGALPPGWTPPPGTVVGAGPVGPSPSPTRSVSASPSPSPSSSTTAPPSGRPTTSPSPTQTSSPTVPPSGTPTAPPSSPSAGPSGGPSGEPSGGPTTPPAEPSGGPTTVSPSPTGPPVDPTPTCEPSPTATSPSPGSGPGTVEPSTGATAGPCPVPCAPSATPTATPTVEPSGTPTTAPSCLPVGPEPSTP